MIKLIKEADEKVKNNLKDFSEQEITHFIYFIDFDRMAEILAEELGIENVTIKVDPEFNGNDAYRNSRGKLYIHFESNNLIAQDRILLAVFTKVVIEDSGARLIVDNGKLSYFAPMHLTWEYVGGDSNGADLPFKMYWDGLKWIVKSER